jgi:hypothetical protein
MSGAASRGDPIAAPETSDEARNIEPPANTDKHVISKFWKSRARNEHVQVELLMWHDMPLLDVRVYLDKGDGISRPSQKGVCLSIKKIDELIAALQKAAAKAEALGWLKKPAC